MRYSSSTPAHPEWLIEVVYCRWRMVPCGPVGTATSARKLGSSWTPRKPPRMGNTPSNDTPQRIVTVGHQPENPKRQYKLQILQIIAHSSRSCSASNAPVWTRQLSTYILPSTTPGIGPRLKVDHAQLKKLKLGAMEQNIKECSLCPDLLVVGTRVRPAQDAPDLAVCKKKKKTD